MGKSLKERWGERLEKMTIGKKRDILCEESKGDIVISITPAVLGFRPNNNVFLSAPLGRAPGGPPGGGPLGRGPLGGAPGGGILVPLLII